MGSVSSQFPSPECSLRLNGILLSTLETSPLTQRGDSESYFPTGKICPFPFENQIVSVALSLVQFSL